jgi:hypothetical protein
VIASENVPGQSARNANAPLLLFAVGGVVGLFNMATATIPFGKGFEMVALAENLARRGAYVNPFWVLDTGPSAANPPMYPLLLALIIKVFGDPRIVALVATLGNILVNAFIAAVMPGVSRIFFRDIRPGIAASILWLLSIYLMPSWDASYTAATLLAFCLFTSATIHKDSFLLPGLFAGLVTGMLFLFNPSTVLIFLPWIVYLAFEHRSTLKQTTSYTVLLLAVFTLIAFSWMFRNHQQLGSYVVRTNFGPTLHASNNDCARSSLYEEELNNCHQAYHPNTSLSEAELDRSLGEVQFDRLRFHDTQAWIHAHKSRFLWLTLARVRDFWFPPLAEHPFHAVILWIVTLFSIPGLVLMAYRRERVTLFVVLVLIAFPLLYYVVISDVRYRIPVLWLSLLPAGYLLANASQLLSKAGLARD